MQLKLSLLLAAVLGSISCHGLVTVQSIVQKISAVGGANSLSGASVAGTLYQDGTPIPFTLDGGPQDFQSGSGSEARWFKPDGMGGRELQFSCDVKGGLCGQFFDIKYKGSDGYCEYARTYLINCPAAKEKRMHARMFGDVERRVPSPETATLCWADIQLNPC